MSHSNMPLSSIIQEAIDHAALCGAFDPDRFLFDAEGVEASVLSALGRHCNEVLGSDRRVMWRMRDNERARRLLALAADPKVLRRRYRKRGPLKDDIFAQVLQMASDPREELTESAIERLIKKQLDDRNSSTLHERSTLREAISALTFAAPLIKGAKAETAREIERKLLTRIIRATVTLREQQILPNGLCGRVAERSAVLEFIASAKDAGTLSGFREPIVTYRKPLENSNYRSLLITGSPGMGKSAFLTDLAQRLKEATDKPVVLSFDFDQMTLAHGGRTAWIAEVSRQLAMLFPKCSQALSAMRAQKAQDWSDGDGLHDSTQAQDMLLATIAIMKDEPAFQNRPLALLFDTLEEITAQDNPNDFQNSLSETSFYYLDTWAEQLGQLNNSVGVAAIFSGRNAPPVKDDDVANLFHAHLVLPELELSPAAELLNRIEKRLSSHDCARIVEGIGGHPLLLILVAKQLRMLNDERLSEEVEAFTRLKLRGIGSEKALQTLYSRFLHRMRMPPLPAGLDEEDIRLLAHPGLLLREVTPDLLENVIAPCVGLDLSTPGHADAAFRALSEQIWLVDRTTSGQSVTHKRDVRRIMLPIMLNDANGSAAKILEKGIHYFEQRNRLSEAGYLRCLRGETDWLLDAPPGIADEIYGFVGADDISLFDVPVRAAVKHLAQSAGALSDEESQALPPELRDAEILQQASKMAAGTGQGQEQFETYSPSVTGPTRDLYDILTDERLATEIANDFVTGNWERAYDTGWNALLKNSGWFRLEQQISTNVQFHERWLWRLTLISMILGPRLDEDLMQIAEGNYHALLSDQVVPDSLIFDIDMLVRPLDGQGVHSRNAIEKFGIDRYDDYLVNLRMMRFMAQSPLFRTSVASRTEPIQIALGSRTHAFLSHLMADKGDFISVSEDAIRNEKGNRNSLVKALVEAVYTGGQNTDYKLEELFGWYNQATFGDGGQFVAIAPLASEEFFRAFVIGQTPEIHETVASAVAVTDNGQILQSLERVKSAGVFWPEKDQYTQFFSDTGRRSTQEKFEIAGELVSRLDLVGSLPNFVRTLQDEVSDERLEWVLRLYDAIAHAWVPLTPAS